MMNENKGFGISEAFIVNIAVVVPQSLRSRSYGWG